MKPDIKEKWYDLQGETLEEREKVIFLDIDGVLNNANFTKWLRSIYVKDAGCKLFDPLCVKAFNRILLETEAVIVISSAWRVLNSTADLAETFERQGINIENRIIGSTSRSRKGRNRGGEISDWLNSYNSPVDFIVIDDNSDMEPVSDRLVLTKFQTGLTEELADKVIKMLRN